MIDKETTDYYSQRAPEYEQIYYRDVPARRKEIDDETAFLRQLTSGKEILDIACGTGYWTQIAAESALSIIACDISSQMIAEAQKKQYKIPPYFLLADLLHLPFAAPCVDFIILGFWFSHHPRQGYQTLFDELKRILKPHGRIWMIDNNPPAEGPLQHSTGIDRHGNNYKQRFLDNGKEYTILKNYFEKQELIDTFSSHFTIERLIHKKYYWSAVLSLS